MTRRMGKVLDSRHNGIDVLQATVKEQQNIIHEQQDCIDTLKARINHIKDTIVPEQQISQVHINQLKQQSTDIQSLKEQITTLTQQQCVSSTTPTRHHNNPSPVLHPPMRSTSNTPVPPEQVTSNPPTVHRPIPLYPHTIQL
jgi:septal ring factor EnvC (AmiA/AmiB activator)